MAKKRLTRKELVKKPDEFITLTGTVIQWARGQCQGVNLWRSCFFCTDPPGGGIQLL